MPKTFEDVIEKHRLLRGASQLRVTLGPGATPDTLDEELHKLNIKTDEYGSYTDLERTQAQVARQRAIFARICTLTRTPEGADVDVLSEKLSQIFLAADFIPDVDIEEDIAFMQAQREKRGEPLPGQTG